MEEKKNRRYPGGSGNPNVPKTINKVGPMNEAMNHSKVCLPHYVFVFML